MTLPASNITRVDPSCMGWLEKLNERSSFIPKLHKTICCSLYTQVTEVQKSIETLMEDLLKGAKMSEEAADTYSVATKELTEAREQARKGWWQQLKRVAVNASQRKQSLAPELHNLAIEICQEFATLWRCIDIRLRTDVGAFWYRADETAQFLSDALKGVVETQKSLKQKGGITENLDLAEFGIQERLISVTLRPSLQLEALVESPVHYIQVSCANGKGDPVTFPIGPDSTSVPKSPIQFIVEDHEGFQITIASLDKDQKLLKTEKLNLHEPFDTIHFDLHESPSDAVQSITLEVDRSYLYVALSESESSTSVFQSHWNLLEKLCQEYHKKANDLQKVFDKVTESENAVSEMDSNTWTKAAQILSIQETDHSKVLKEMFYFLSKDALLLTQDKQPSELMEDLTNPEAVASHVVSVLKQIKELANKSKKLKFNEDQLLVNQTSLSNQNLLLTMDLKTQWTSQMKDAWLEFWKICLLFQTAVSSSDEKFELLCTQQQEWLDNLKESLLPSHVQTNWEEETAVLFNNAVKLRTGRIEWSGPFESTEKVIKNVEDLQQQSNENGVLFGARMQDRNQLMICDREDGGCGLSSSSPIINFGISLHPDDLHETTERQVQLVEVINRTQRVMTVGLEPEIKDNEREKLALMAPKKVRLYGNTLHKFRMVVNKNVIGKVQETWILRSDDVHLNEIFTLCVNVQRLGVKLDTEVIDFGIMITASRRESVIKLRSITDLPLLVKTQQQISQETKLSELRISQDSFRLLPRTSQDLTVSLKASHQPERIDIDLMVAIVSSKNLKSCHLQ